METNTLFLSLIVVFPLVGALLNGFLFRKVNRIVTVVLATACVFIPFILALKLVFWGPVFSGTPVTAHWFDWISISLSDSSQFTIPFSFTVDRLSGLLLLIITGVGTLIHVYAGEYMHHEEGVYRFFAYLNLFIFSMLCLALGSNMLVTFLGWEGVGACSYFLIGYWYSEEANARAGMKAFIANRVGDLGFLIAMFLCYILFGTLEYAELALRVASVDAQFWIANSTLVTLLCAGLLLGVTGKSAQLPLFVWLPDAMAGPTPVSALIHAATMVTSGIYLMTRLSFLLVQSPAAMTAIAIVGAATALFAATIGLVQNDIKKVLAYSTVSQLGFMVLGCGVGAFQYGVAHLMTHAFFKALLFLGAGSVIHAMHHEQDIRKMGGLIKKLPITGWTFVIGTLAIIGFPGFSGFFSKDEILYYAWSGPFGHPIFWVVGVLAAACTSFYMVRLTYLTFFGTSRVDSHTSEHLHENPLSMTLPLIVLAVLSIFGGYVSLPHAIAHLFHIEGDNLITKWLLPVIQQAKETFERTGRVSHGSSSLEWGLMAISTLIMFAMSSLAIFIYKKGPEGGKVLADKVLPLHKLVLDKWRIDELYKFVLIEPLKMLGSFLFKVGDRALVEGVVNEGPKGIYLVTAVVSDLHAGLLRNYVKLIFICVLFFVVLFVI
jgi:NADH-quinone oxidoreductase subunit L